MVSYLLVLLVCVLLGDGPRRRMAIACVLVDLVVFFACMFIARGEIEKWRFAADMLYRLGLIACWWARSCNSISSCRR